jgi:hypothetical protein
MLLTLANFSSGIFDLFEKKTPTEVSVLNLNLGRNHFTVLVVGERVRSDTQHRHSK